MKLTRWLALALCTLACTAARAYQIFFCYDEFGLPTDGAGFLSLVPVVCFALFALLAFRVKDKGSSMAERFRFEGTLALFCGVLGAFALVAAAVLLVLGGAIPVTMLLAAFLAVSGACVFYVLVCLRKGRAFPGIAAGFPAAYLAVQLVFTYRDCAKDPVLMNFYLELLALASLAWAFVQLCAFAFRGGSARGYLTFSMISIALSAAAAVTAATLFWMLLLGGFAFVQLAFLFAWKD